MKLDKNQVPVIEGPINPLPDAKMLTLSKLKAFADKNLMILETLNSPLIEEKILSEKEKMLVTSIFSTPEHKVLMVSFCDRPMSGVRHPSCVVNNFFIHLLLLNHRANLDETWQGCAFGEARPKLFKRLNSTHNSGCHGNQKEKIAKSLKIFFYENRKHTALIFGMFYLLVDLYQDCSYDVPGVKTGPRPRGHKFET